MTGKCKWVRVFAIGAAVCGLHLGVTAEALPPRQVDVVIIGAGLSGLATAYELKKAGIKAHILELTPRVGGRVRTVEYDYRGQHLHVDAGMEEYWASNPAVPLLKSLKLPLLEDVAHSSLFLQGKLQVLKDNESKEDFARRIFGEEGLAALKKFEKTVEPILKQLKPGRLPPQETLKLKDLAFSAWVQKQELPVAVSEWIRISIECEAGAAWDRISALDGIAEYHIMMGPGEKHFRVVGGNEKFTSAITRAIGEDHISLNHRVNRVVSDANGVTIHYLDTATSRSSSIRAKRVVSTVPLYRLFEVQFEPAVSAKKMQAIQSQSWGAYFKAHLFLPKEAQSHWMKPEGSIMPILSDSEAGVIYDGNPDQTDGTRILSLLITGPAAERFNLMPLDVVRATVFQKIDQFFPGLSSQVENIEFYRYHPRAIAAWPPGRSRFDELSQEIRRPENGVHFAGDFTETSHSDGAFISAHRVSNEIIQALAPRHADRKTVLGTNLGRKMR